MVKYMGRYKEIERNLITKYRKDIWSKFVKGISEYKMIKENDKIAVCISGGKDSFLMAKCFQELQKHGKVKFELEFIVMNPGYAEKNIKKIKYILTDIHKHQHEGQNKGKEVTVWHFF